MIINSTTDRVYIMDSPTESGNYVIYRLDPRGCKIESTKIAGTLVDNYAEHHLEDGPYIILFYSDDAPDIGEVFHVFYNGLSRFVKNVQSIVCPCTSCPRGTTVDYSAIFFELIGYLQKTGLLCSLQGLKGVLDKCYKLLEQEAEYQAYYGKFSFNYKKAIEECLVFAYIELYNMSLENPRREDHEVDTMNAAFNVGVIEKCLYSLGYNVEEIVCRINNLKCNCDE